MPAKELIYKTLIDSFILYKPKDIVSGDFYFFHKTDDKFYIAAADCTGHGVPGAIMSMICSEKLEDALTKLKEPADILKHVNQNIKKSLGQNAEHHTTNDGMDIALCSVDLTNRNLKYAGANRPLWIVRAGSNAVEEVKATKRAIGGHTPDEQIFEQHQITLNKNDSFYLSSDGFADSFNKQGKKLTTGKFKELLCTIQNKTMHEQEEHLNTFIKSWIEGGEQIDDILVIGFRFS